MVRLIEHKRIIVACIILISIVSTVGIIMLPKRTTEIKNNIVYMSGYYTEYPDKDDPRYYVEFKNDGTYVLMYDDSRRYEGNYNEEGNVRNSCRARCLPSSRPASYPMYK